MCYRDLTQCSRLFRARYVLYNNKLFPPTGLVVTCEINSFHLLQLRCLGMVISQNNRQISADILYMGCGHNVTGRFVTGQNVTDKMSHRHIVTGQNFTLTKFYKTKYHMSKRHMDKMSQDKMPHGENVTRRKCHNTK